MGRARGETGREVPSNARSTMPLAPTGRVRRGTDVTVRRVMSILHRRATVATLLTMAALAALPGSALGGTSSVAAAYQPDARIKLACAYTTDWQPCESDWVGNDVYNKTANGQKSRWTDYLTYSNERDPRVIVFKISVQNDGSRADRFTVAAGGITSGYRVKFLLGTGNITAAVEAGTYRTPLLAPGAALVIEAKVVMPCDSWNNCGQDRATRLVTVGSTANPSLRDAVKFVREIWECTC